MVHEQRRTPLPNVIDQYNLVCVILLIQIQIQNLNAINKWQKWTDTDFYDCNRVDENANQNMVHQC